MRLRFRRLAMCHSFIISFLSRLSLLWGLRGLANLMGNQSRLLYFEDTGSASSLLPSSLFFLVPNTHVSLRSGATGAV